MPGGAAALITALNSAKTVKSTANLTKTVKGINEAQENGALDQINSIFSNLTSAGPLMGVVQYIFGQIAAGTADETINLFKELMELLQSEEGKAAIKNFTDMLNTILLLSAKVVGVVNDINASESQFSNFVKRIGDLVNFINNFNPLSIQGIIKTFTSFISVIKKAETEVNNLHDSMNPFLRTLIDIYNTFQAFNPVAYLLNWKNATVQLVNVIQVVVGWIEEMKDWLEELWKTIEDFFTSYDLSDLNLPGTGTNLGGGGYL